MLKQTLDYTQNNTQRLTLGTLTNLIETMYFEQMLEEEIRGKSLSDIQLRYTLAVDPREKDYLRLYMYKGMNEFFWESVSDVTTVHLN